MTNMISDQLNRIDSEINRLAGIYDIGDFVFAISLRSKASSKSWERVVNQLSITLDSILKQEGARYQVYICGHEKPCIPHLEDKRVKWITATHDAPSDPRYYSQDKMRKRRIIGAELKKAGWNGYFMPFDADDVIHHRFLEYFGKVGLQELNFLGSGFVVNWRMKKVWVRLATRNPFYKGCGTSSIFWFNNEDLPDAPYGKHDAVTRFSLALADHTQVALISKALGTPVNVVPLPLAAWILDHGNNNSMIKGVKATGAVSKDAEELGTEFCNAFSIRI